MLSVEQITRLFEAQSRLVDYYHQEFFDKPYNFQSQEYQAQIRGSVIWIAEECAELAYASHDHAPEELADVTHFLAEMTIMSGAAKDVIAKVESWSDIPDVRTATTVVEGIGAFLIALGDATHELKNTYWRKTFRESNCDSFNSKMVVVWRQLMLLAQCLGMTSSDLYRAYLEKNIINLQRIRDAY